MEKELVKNAKVGDIVIFQPPLNDTAARSNSAEEIPAIVTHNFGSPESCLNLKCFPDGTGTLWRTSVQHQTLGIKNGSAVMSQGYSWRWPDEPKLRNAESDAALESTIEEGDDS
jgi:hypothetical protein